ncbi:MAG TPA: hypothetical protein VGI95_04080 [Caulobacteraceae bacterium]
MDVNNFQRVGAISNTHAGREFELAAQLYWAETGVRLERDFGVPVGFKVKKLHRFDLGSEDPPILVECKSYTWTSGGNSPSAKIRGMNEAMLHFSVAPARYRKILFVLKHMRGELSLATHYVRTQGHLIGPDVEVWEFGFAQRTAERVL